MESVHIHAVILIPLVAAYPSKSLSQRLLVKEKYGIFWRQGDLQAP
ncbi:hypothetical protein AVEN_176864-1, partial [Araneus ventricosus]